MHSRAHGFNGIGDDSRTFWLFFALSTLCHVVFFGVLVFAPGLKIKPKQTLSVINVSMVTLPASPKTSFPDQKPAKRVTPREPIRSKPPASVSVAPEKKIKKSLKKETFKSSKVIERAITRIEKEVEESRPSQVTEAIERLKDRVQKDLGPEQHKQEVSKEPFTGVGSGSKSKKILELIDIYRIEIAYQIQRNWAFAEQLAGGRRDLVAELAFTIMPNGEIRDIWFDKRSGNNYLDESAKKAILKSNPLRPHPPGVEKPFITVGLRFTPKGVK